MARWLDLMLCIFPFEADLYNKSGLRTIFVGHPMIERLAADKNETSRDPNLIALFPGSRRREIRKIFPIMLETARQLRRTHRNLMFDVAAASAELAREMKEMADDAGEIRQRIRIRVGETARIMQSAYAGMVASGSATQEAAYFRLPFVLIYKVSWPTYLAGRLVIKVNHLGMPNVLANREIVPEFIQHRARAVPIAEAMLRLANDSPARAEMISAFDQIIATLGQAGASMRAAQAIMEELGEDARRKSA
jgi:lipid-A-disaccharide synthase